MPDSITVHVPSMRRLGAIVVALVGLAVLLIVGVAIGTRLFPADPVSRLMQAGVVQQVRVTTGILYVGRVAARGETYIELAEPAIVRQADTGAVPSSAPRLAVEALSIEPYDTGGDLLIPIASVEWVAIVRPGSGLETAYRQAIAGAAGAPGASSTP